MKFRTEELYKHEYWEQRGARQSLKSELKDEFGRARRNRWEAQYKYCRDVLDGKRTLFEIGAGAGQNLLWFEEIGLNVVGIEPDEKNVSFINSQLKHGNCITCFAENIDLPDVFDVIWISHVLEHLVRPDLLLKRLVSNLTKEGILFIEVPNCGNPEVLKGSIDKNPSLYHFNVKSLLNISKNAGYQIKKIDVVGHSTSIQRLIKNCIERYFTFLHINIYPYYPYVTCSKEKGLLLRILLHTSK